MRYNVDEMGLHWKKMQTKTFIATKDFKIKIAGINITPQLEAENETELL